MEPIALRYFREVAALGSVRHAAERLFVAQSAISRQIALLENELGISLFERHARGMSLTDAGRHLLDYANEQRSRFDELRGVIQEYENLKRGHVDITCVEGLMYGFLPDALRSFSAINPGITFGVATQGSHAVAEAVAEHRADLGIVFGNAPRTDLIELARMPQPLYAAVSAAHPLAARSHCSLGDISPWPVVLPERSFAIRQLLDTACADRKLNLVRAVEVNTLAFAQRLVKGSDTLVTFLPVDLLIDEVEAGELAALSIDEPSLKARYVTLVASRTGKLSQAARQVALWLEEKMGDKRAALPRVSPRRLRKASA